MTTINKKYLLDAVNEIADLSDEMMTSVVSELIENLCDDNAMGVVMVSKFVLKRQNELSKKYSEYKFDFPITNEMLMWKAEFKL